MFLSTLGYMYLFELVFLIFLDIYPGVGFPGSSAGKESACNVGDPCSIPGLGRSPGEGIGYPLQYFQRLSLLAPLNMNNHIQDAPSAKLKTSLDP